MPTPSETVPDAHRDRFDSLLEPSLGVSHQPISSMRATFLTSFFGGVFAWAWFGFANAKRMGRDRADRWFYIAGTLAWSIVVVWFGYALAKETLPAWLEFADRPGQAFRYIGRGLALALLGMMYLRQRDHFRAQALMPGEPPNPWRQALVAILLSMVFSFVGVALGAAIGST